MKSSYHVEFHRIPRQLGFHVFRGTKRDVGHLSRFGWPRGDMCQAMGESNIELKWGSHVTHGIIPFEGNLS